MLTTALYIFSFVAIVLFGINVVTLVQTGKRVEKQGSSQQTKPFPIYYLNLDRSPHRQAYMEEAYSQAGFGPLIRIRAVDGRNETELLESVEVGNRTIEEYKKVVGATTGELALTASHLKALRRSHQDGRGPALFLEDDASTDLVPFWLSTLEGIVSDADEEVPGWGLLRLQYVSYKQQFYDEWRLNVSRKFFPSDYAAYGAVAYIASKEAMKVATDRFFTKDGKIDCLRRVTNSPCVADHLLHFELRPVYSVAPPMFTCRMNEGTTGVRCKGLNCPKGQNDKEGAHSESYLRSLQWALEAKELQFPDSIGNFMRKRTWHS